MLIPFKLEIISSYDGIVMHDWCKAQGVDNVNDIIKEIEEEFDF